MMMPKATIFKKFASDNVLNSIRRVLVNEIPTWTFDNVQFINFNSSIYNMEYIIQRLHLIPLIQEHVPEGANGISAECNVNNNTPSWRKVTPRDIKIVGGSINNMIEKDILNNLPIIYLPPNESIHFKMSFAKSNKNGYNKYCHCWYDDNSFYIESIGKCKDPNKAIQNAIQYLIQQCNTIKDIVAKKSKDAPLSEKVEINISNVSRSALNLIIKTFRDEFTQAVAYTKWYRKHGDFNGISDIESLVTPDDFIVAVTQPHMSEQSFKIFIDMKDIYIRKTQKGTAKEETNNAYVPYVPDIFVTLMKRKGIDGNNTVNHICYRLLCQAIDLTVKTLSEMMNNKQ